VEESVTGELEVEESVSTICFTCLIPNEMRLLVSRIEGLELGHARRCLTARDRGQIEGPCFLLDVSKLNMENAVDFSILLL
jgi:hypothetical protein